LLSPEEDPKRCLLLVGRSAVFFLTLVSI